MPSISKRSLALLAALLAIVLPAGCVGGDDDDSGDGGDAAVTIESFGSQLNGRQAQQAEAALRRYLAARSSREWKKACSLLAESVRRLLSRVASRSEQIEGEGCAAALADSARNLLPSEHTALDVAEVESVRAERNRAFILFEAADGGRYAMRATREDRRWGMSPSSLPLG